jgi:hypothetical protein
MRKKTQVLIWVMVLALSSSLLWGQGEGPREMRLMMKIDRYMDGSEAVSYFELDPDTFTLEPIALGEIEESTGAADKLQSAVVTRSWHWKSPAKITFTVTKESKKTKNYSKTRTIINKYCNQRRGNTNVPRMVIKKNVVKVVDMEDFIDPWDYYIQLDFDSKNTIVMTNDDQFFKDPDGNYFDPELVATTKVFAHISVRQEGDIQGRNRWVGTLWIDEGDVYFVKNFFKLAKNVYNQVGTAAIRGTLGFQSNTWSHSYKSAKGHHVSSSAFNNPTSDVWTKTSYPRDDFYYLDLFAANITDYLDTPQLMPFENEVIDIGEYELPKKETGRIDVGKTPILFLTNLKAYAGNKKLRIKFWRLTDDNPPKEVAIVTINGNTLQYPYISSDGTEVFVSIFLNHIRIGQKGKLTKLKSAVETHGKERVIDGITFEKALKIKVRISGHLSENTGKKNINRTFWLVCTEPEN